MRRLCSILNIGVPSNFNHRGYLFVRFQITIKGEAMVPGGFLLPLRCWKDQNNHLSLTVVYHPAFHSLKAVQNIIGILHTCE